MASATEPDYAQMPCEVCGDPFDARVTWFDAGHDPRCNATDRHFHPVISMPICPDCRFGIKQASKRINLSCLGIGWVAVHGNLLLALRHPENRGPSRKHVVEFVKILGAILEEHGVLSPNTLRKTYRLEVEAGNSDFRDLVEPELEDEKDEEG